jgi:uncharacterized protein (DUF433 family)
LTGYSATVTSSIEERAVESRINLVGIGLYTPAEAGRLIQVRPAKLARWLRGHSIKGKHYEPLWRAQADLGEDGLYLGFRDLMEARVAAAFIARNLSPIKVRQAIVAAREMVGIERPLSTSWFRTDGRTVMLEIVGPNGEPRMIDLLRKQHVFKSVVEQSLKGVDFDEGGTPARWWPAGKAAGVVLDPERSFGKPIDAETSVPTDALAAATVAEGSFEAAAQVWGVPVRAVRRAVAFQDEMARRQTA